MLSHELTHPNDKGRAQKLFASLTEKDKDIVHTEELLQWPFLQKMLSTQRLGYVDFSLANRLLEKTDEECIAAFICHLSMAARKGHICIKIENHTLLPHPADIWISEEFQETLPLTSLADTNELNTLILQGAQAISDSPLYTNTHNGQLPTTPICHNDNHYYLQRYWSLETECLSNLQLRFLNKAIIPSKHIPFQPIERLVISMLEEGKLLPEQAQAILKSSQSLLTLITGGPGTGKTYTAGLLLRTVWEAIPLEERSDFQIALAAPTGKAAANLEASIRRALTSVEGFPPPSAQTLHQLLKINKNNKRRIRVTLTADLILVDESSMIDMNLMSQLLQAIKPGARLILLGDRHQLPSVEAGAIFADLIACFESYPQEQVSLATLQTCLRAELKGIIDLATCVNKGKEKESLALLDKSLNGIRRLSNEQPLTGKQQQKHLLAHVIPHFPVITSLPENPWSALEQFSRFRILTPMRKGLLGVESLNSVIHQTMKQSMCCVFPIIVMQNDYRLGLFNGEVGLIVQDDHQEFAFFASRDTSQEVRRIPRLLMPRFEYAYCLSIHKSQGSEFDHVVLLLPEGSECFGREALYTGITRAKKQLDIWSPDTTLQRMIRSVTRRQSGVTEKRLQAMHQKSNPLGLTCNL